MVTVKGSLLLFDWKDNANNEMAFKLEVSTNGGTSYTVMKTIEGRNINKTFENEMQPGSYKFRVKAKNGSGDSGASNVVDVRVGVPDAPVLQPLGLVSLRLTQADAAKGFILDGFPRTVAQAEGLTKLLAELGKPIDAVLLFEVNTDQLVQRLSGRRVCELCKKVFNIHTAPPSVPPECVPGRAEHQVVQRPDDREETVRERAARLRREDPQTGVRLLLLHRADTRGGRRG